MPLVPFMHPRKAIPRRSSGTQNHQAFAFSAPVKGLDVSQPLPGANPLTAVRLDNLVPRVFGCELRSGYLRWCSNMEEEVRTLMDFQPAFGDPELFAATADNKIYDVTHPLDSGMTPPVVLTTTGGSPPGEFSYVNFTTDAGIHVLVAVSADTGYYVYDGAAWTQITMGAGPDQIDGVNPEVFSYVTQWKGRLWFIEEGTTRAWYLPGGVYYGAATMIDFGPFFANGGSLQAITNWTMDGGDGMDDKIIFISSQGDVLVYQGNDPDDAATFQIIGRWFLGRVPVGHRFFSQYATDVAILSERGMSFLSELMRGQGFFMNSQVAQAVNSEVARAVAGSLTARYWELRFLPHEQLIVINIPQVSAEDRQWAFEVNNRAFCMLTNMPMHTVMNFNGASYFGDLSGNVWWAFSGDSDGAVDDVRGTDLEGVVITAFSALGDPVRLKRFLMVRPSFNAPGPPGVIAQLNANWVMSIPAAAPPYLAAGASLWDQGEWNTAIWSGGSFSYEAWQGAAGTGRYGSLAMRVRGLPGTAFIGWQAVVEPGGIL